MRRQISYLLCLLNRAERETPLRELQTYQLGFYPVAGGLPIVVNKQMIGVIGVAPRSL